MPMLRFLKKHMYRSDTNLSWAGFDDNIRLIGPTTFRDVSRFDEYVILNRVPTVNSVVYNRWLQENPDVLLGEYVDTETRQADPHDQTILVYVLDRPLASIL